jgi:voltage-gated potassium channel
MTLLDESSKAGRWFIIITQFFIFVSVVVFSLSTLPDLTIKQIHTLDTIELVVLFVFVAEYLFRLAVTKHRLKFALSFYGVVDFISIVPALLGANTQAFRVFRVLRIFKIFRYNKAINRLTSAVSENKDELILFFIASLIVIYIAAAGIYVFENPVQPDVFRSIFDALWWAVATLTTVGYGDIYPITVGGKLFTYVILMIGLGIVAIPTGLIASTLSKKND